MASKNYSIRWDENNEAIGFEIDGVTYKTLDEIPDHKDLKKIMAMMSAAEQVDLDDENTSGVKPENVIVNIFTGVAVLMLIITAIATFNNIRGILKEKSAPGVVTDMVMKRDYVNEQDHITQDYYFPVVQFTAQDGKRRNVQMDTGSSSPEYEKGDEVTVRYDPDHPLQARIDSFDSSAIMWILPSITGILGVVFLGAVILVRKYLLSA